LMTLWCNVSADSVKGKVTCMGV